MPDFIRGDEFNALLNDLLKKEIENKSRARSDAIKYLANPNIDIKTLAPIAIVFIIAKLDKEKQVEFIRNNIDYLKENKSIFKQSLEHKSPAEYMHYETLREIARLDKELFKYIFVENCYHLFRSMSEEQKIMFHQEFNEIIKELDDMTFVVRFVTIIMTGTSIYLYEIINDVYKDKINNLQGRALLEWCEHFGKLEYMLSKKEDIVRAFLSLSDSAKQEYLVTNSLSDDKGAKFHLILSDCLDESVKKDILSRLTLKSLIILYQNDYLIESIDPFVKAKSSKYSFVEDVDREELMKILDSYDYDMSDLLNKYLYDKEDKNDIVLNYLESKYRNSIICNDKLFEIDENLSSFSNEYLHNIKLIKELIINEKMDVNDKEYKKHLKVFINFLKDKGFINRMDEYELNVVSNFFYNVVNGKNFSSLIPLKSINGLAMYNRLHKTPFEPSFFSVEQLINYNVKQHKDLYSMIEDKNGRKYLTLKLMLMVGYEKAKYILSIDNSIETLEHLVGNVKVNNIKLDSNKNPIVKKRLVNMLFNDKDYPRIKDLLLNKQSLLYKYFPRMFNEWNEIASSHHDKNMLSIISFLEGAEVNLPSKYYRLQEELKYIGCSHEIVESAKECHDLALSRVKSSIPRIVGSIDGYEYEVLKLHDIKGMSVGNKTDCCFTIKGVGKKCLRHAMSDENGRILVVRKNGELLAHSWIWRNGQLLCIDSIEVFKGNQDWGFKNVYLDFAKKVIDVTTLNEDNEGIKTVIVGGTNDIKKLNLYNQTYMNTKGLLPINYSGYSDLKTSYGIVSGNEFFKLGNPHHTYLDEREPLFSYKHPEDNEINKNIIKHINYLRYCKAEEEGTLENYKNIYYMYNFREIYMNEDWYILVDNKGNIESYLLPYDPRAKIEFEENLNLVKNRIMEVRQ